MYQLPHERLEEIAPHGGDERARVALPIDHWHGRPAERGAAEPDEEARGLVALERRETGNRAAKLEIGDLCWMTRAYSNGSVLR